MKKLFLFIISVCIVMSLCSCSVVLSDKSQPVELVFHYNESSVDAQLTEQDSKAVYEMFDGKELYFDEPSCGFDENISLRINGRAYCPACDSCCTVKDCGSGMYFTISQSERNTIERIFRKHGGYFPCV